MITVKISLIMAVYNAEKYLKEAVDTILSQEFEHFELICVDDGSTDKSLSILRDYQKLDRRIRVFEFKSEKDGAAEARNFGMLQATGEYLLFLDADDFFEPDMLSSTYLCAKETGADIVLFDAWCYDDNTKEQSIVPWTIVKENIPEKKLFTPDECADVIFDISGGQAWNKLYRKDYIFENKIRFASVIPDDQFFTFMAFACANSITVVYQRFLHYRINSEKNQTSNVVSMHPEAGYVATDLLYEELVRRGMYEKYKVALVNRGLATAVTMLNNMSDEKCFMELYDKLKGVYLRKWGSYDISSEKIARYRKILLDDITKFSSAGYLFKEYKWRKKAMARNIIRDKLRLVINENSKIVIYGAGNKGKEVFGEIFRSGMADIVLWVDKNFSEIGYPIKDVCELRSTDFDYIVIAIENEKISNDVRDYLITLDIDTEKIIQISHL